MTRGGVSQPRKRSRRPTYLLRLRPEPGVHDPVRVLRSALKYLLRRHGLRCIDAREGERQ
jgi:hypothetical protein